MKILMVNKFLHPQGGSETYTFKVGEYLSENGYEVEYFGMEHEGRIVGNRVNAYTSDMDFHSRGLARLLYPLKILYSREAKIKILKVLEDFDPAIVHINNFNFQLTPSILYGIVKFAKKHNKKIGILYTAHDVQLTCPNHLMLTPVKKELCQKCAQGAFSNCVKGKCIHNSFAKSLIGTMEGYLYRFLKTYRYFDAVICPSEFNKEQLAKNEILRDKLIMLRNFVQADMACGEVKSKEDYILFLGRFSEEKGIKLLLEACTRLSDIPFIFAGSGPLEEEINQVSNIKNVGFVGGAKLKRLLERARFVVLPSICYENSPFTIMEAHLNGTPVIGSDIGGIPELIEHEKNGLLFENRNLEDLISKITYLWQNRDVCDKLSGNCLKIRYDSLEDYCNKLSDIYLFTLSKKGVKL